MINIEDLVQDCSIFSALRMEILQSCIEAYTTSLLIALSITNIDQIFLLFPQDESIRHFLEEATCLDPRLKGSMKEQAPWDRLLAAMMKENDVSKVMNYGDPSIELWSSIIKYGAP